MFSQHLVNQAVKQSCRVVYCALSGPWSGWIRPKCPSDPEPHLLKARIWQYRGQQGPALSWASGDQPSKSKSPKPRSVVHPSHVAKACSFLLTTFPPVDYCWIPSRFFFSNLTSIYIWSNGQPSAREKYVPGPTGAFLKFSSPASLSRH